MAFLATELHASLNISSGGTVLTYAYTGNAPKIVLCRVKVGSSSKPIVGGSNYVVRSSINGTRVSPDSNVSVPNGVTETLLQSREITLHSGDTIEFVVDGEVSDTAVATESSLLDMTPLTSAEVYGSGSVSVDHNYGGTDNIRYVTETGEPIDNAQLQAFLKVDYDAGNRGAAYVVGESKTKADGRWMRPMMLDPGEYTIVGFKQAAFGPDTKNITVA